MPYLWSVARAPGGFAIHASDRVQIVPRSGTRRRSPAHARSRIQRSRCARWVSCGRRSGPLMPTRGQELARTSTRRSRRDHVDPVKFGLVGYGFGGRYFHAPLIASAEECEFIGVVTRSDERRGLVSEEHPGVATLRLARGAGGRRRRGGGHLDAGRYPLVLTDQAIELGLSVVCDKPFALDPAAARETVALASSSRSDPQPLPEPSLGLRLPDRARPGRRRNAG